MIFEVSFEAHVFLVEKTLSLLEVIGIFCHVHIRDVQSHSALDGHWCSPGFRCCSLFCSLEHRTRAGTYGETGLWYHLKTGSLVDAIAYTSLKDRLVS